MSYFPLPPFSICYLSLYESSQNANNNLTQIMHSECCLKVQHGNSFFLSLSHTEMLAIHNIQPPSTPSFLLLD